MTGGDGGKGTGCAGGASATSLNTDGLKSATSDGQVSNQMSQHVKMCFEAEADKCSFLTLQKEPVISTNR